MFLARLPPELRDRVYKLVLVAPHEYQPIKWRSAMELEFLEVCRQIYQEARHIPYRYNDIAIFHEELVIFLSIIGQKNRDELERLTILGRPVDYVLNTWALIRRCSRLKSLRIEGDLCTNRFGSGYKLKEVKFDLDSRLEVTITNDRSVPPPGYYPVDEDQVRAWWASAKTAESCVTGLSV